MKMIPDSLFLFHLSVFQEWFCESGCISFLYDKIMVVFELLS